MRNYLPHGIVALFGLVMGFCLSRIGFSNYDELYRMFLFSDFRLLLSFAGAVGIAMIGFALLARREQLPAKPLHRGTAIGAVLFGIGWAITGACPSIALVQLGEGRLPAVATIAGLLLGIWLHKKLKARFFRWDGGGCEV